MLRIFSFESTNQSPVTIRPVWHSLHLAVNRGIIDGRSTIDIMVGSFTGHHHILHVNAVAVTPGASTRYNHIRLVTANHFCGSQGGIHFADATLLYNHTVWVEKVLQLLQLFVHSYDNSNFHLTKY